MIFFVCSHWLPGHLFFMHGVKRDILTTAKATGLFDVARRRSAHGLRILCYHGVWMGPASYPGDAMFMQTATFRRRLEIIRRCGYPVVSLADAAAALQGRGPSLPPAAIVITIDDGWFGTYRDMLPALEEFGMAATLYCDTAQLMEQRPIAHVMARYLDRIAGSIPASERRQSIDVDAAADARRMANDLSYPSEMRDSAAHRLAAALGLDLAQVCEARAFEYMTPAELRDAHSRGLDIQLHSHRHTLGDMSAAVIGDEIRQNRHILSEILGREPSDFKHFCYPSGLTNWSAPQSLSALGITTSVTTFPGLTWPDANLQLLPRLHDGENMSDLEFEAELSGFGDWLRRGKRLGERLTFRRHRSFASPNEMAQSVNDATARTAAEASPGSARA